MATLGGGGSGSGGDVPLSAMVQMGPLRLDGGEDFVNLQMEMNTDRLTGTLVKLSNTISKNAKVTNSLAEDLALLRGVVDTQVAKLNRAISVLDESVRLIRDQLGRTVEEVKALNEFSVRKAELQAEVSRIDGDVAKCQFFVSDFDREDGAIRRWVRAHTDSLFPVWNEIISSGLFARMQRETELVRKGIIDSMDRDKDTVTQTLTQMVIELDGRCGRRFEGLEETEKALSSGLAKTTQETQRLDGWLDTVAKASDQLKQETHRFIAHATPRLERAETAHGNLVQLLGTTDSFIASITRQSIDLDATAPGAPTSDHRVQAVLHLPFARALSDQMVARVDASHAASQRELQRVHHDVTQKLDDKVGLTTLEQLLVQYKDKELYAMAEAQAKAIAAIQSSKVDSKTLEGLLKTKADKDALDGKADRTYVSQTVRSALERAQEAFDAAQKAQASVADQGKLIALIRTGGGGVGVDGDGSGGSSILKVSSGNALSMSGGGGGSHDDSHHGSATLRGGGGPASATHSPRDNASWGSSSPRIGGGSMYDRDGRQGAAGGQHSLSDMLFKMSETKFQNDVKGHVIPTPPVSQGTRPT